MSLNENLKWFFLPSSGDSRDTPGANFDENNQQSGSNQGLIPQIVMNPWGSEAPMMTFAVQAYQHQWLLQVCYTIIIYFNFSKNEMNISRWTNP